MVVATRFLKKKTTSSITGITKELGTGEFGSATRKDVIYDFFENKFSPIASVFKELLEGETFEGKKLTWKDELKNLAVPLPITTYEELKKTPGSANILMAMIAETLGLGVNTYSISSKAWRNPTSKKLLSFKAQLGDDKYEKVTTEFEAKLDSVLSPVFKSKEYKKMDNEKKQKTVDYYKGIVEKAIFSKYGYTPPSRTSTGFKSSF